MIRTEGLTKTYTMKGKTVHALDHVSLHIARGEYVAIIGPSGSGKSTLMHLLGCLDAPTSGRYLLNGQDVSRLNPETLARVRGEEIGFVFQGFQLLPRMTAEENVALPLLLCGVPLKARMETSRRLLTQVGEARIKGSKTQITFSGKYGFAFVSHPRRKKDQGVLVSFGLFHRQESDRIHYASEPYPGRWTHHMLVQQPEEIDDELMGWIQEAYWFANTK